MRLCYFSSSVNSLFKHASIQGARSLIFGQILHLHPYFMCANKDGSGETARMRRLIRAGSPEPSLVAYVISTIISWAGSNKKITYRYTTFLFVFAWFDKYLNSFFGNLCFIFHLLYNIYLHRYFFIMFERNHIKIYEIWLYCKNFNSKMNKLCHCSVS